MRKNKALVQSRVGGLPECNLDFNFRDDFHLVPSSQPAFGFPRQNPPTNLKQVNFHSFAGSQSMNNGLLPKAAKTQHSGAHKQ